MPRVVLVDKSLSSHQEMLPPATIHSGGEMEVKMLVWGLVVLLRRHGLFFVLLTPSPSPMPVLKREGGFWARGFIKSLSLEWFH